jgi:LAO/AO transport system kinase
MSSINPESLKNFRQHRKKILPAAGYFEGIMAHDRNLLGQAITLIESVLPEHQELARELLMKCLPCAGNSLRIGITGVPGVGKSTFIEAFGQLITASGSSLAVLAIDPSSDRSKGSILGDKTRMESLAADPAAFIRPSPSGGSLGGVARKTRETIILCEAAGYRTIIVETVGVGQSETSVHSMVDFFLLLMLPGAGDELQGIKRGIMEMADAVAITKADGDNMIRTAQAVSDFENALHLYPPAESGWVPKVMSCSALNHTGLQDIWQLILDYEIFTKKSGYFSRRRNEQSRYWLHEFISRRLISHFYSTPGMRERITRLEKMLLDSRITSWHAAEELLQLYFKDLTGRTSS